MSALGRWSRLAGALFAGIALGGCDDESGGDAACPEGTVRSGGACIAEPLDADRPSADRGVDLDGGADMAVAPDAGPMGSLPVTLDDFFAASGYMGDGETGGIVATMDCPTRGPAAAGLCHAFQYTRGAAGWGGVWWQSPDGNWGDAPGFAMPAGATRVQFSAWGAAGGERLTFLAGYGPADGFGVEATVELATTPTTYTLDLAGVPYTDIAGGFGWVADGVEAGLGFYIDDIRYLADPADAVDPCNVACATLRGIECADVPAFGACRDRCEERIAGPCGAEAAAWTGCVDDGGWRCVDDAAQAANDCAAERAALIACEGGDQPAALPFYIDDHFVMSGYMGGGEVEVADCPADEGAGTCRQITWTPGESPWVGFFFQYPENNWGDLPGLALAPGATHVRYRAWGATGGERANFAIGIADADADGFSVESGYGTLPAEPVEGYLEVPAGVEELTGGFAWFLENPTGAASITFFLDDVEWRDDALPGGDERGCTDPSAANHTPGADVDDGSCLYAVTFQVDMGCTDTPFAQVNVTGPFCQWCAEGFPLADDDDDGIWEATYNFPVGPLEYKYMVDGFVAQENLIDDVQAGAGECAPITDGAGFANRQVEVAGSMTQSDTYGQCVACGDEPPPPPPVGDFATITFDDAGTMYGLVGFGGAEDSIVTADPTDGQNQVARVIKSANAELWAGTTFSTRPNNAVGRIAFAPGRTRMTIRVYSPDAGVQVRLKVENANDPTVSVETEATTTVANQWEVLTFDFATQAPGTAAVNFAATYDKASIFFGFGTTGAQAGGAKTSFFDDVSFPEGEPPPPPVGGFATVTFDDAGIMYGLVGFGGAEDAIVTADPTDAQNQVARVIKSANAELWAGTTFSTRPNNAVGRIALAPGRTRMTVRVYSPDAGVQVRLKVENANDPTVSVETEATTTVANQWEVLTFDFAAQAPGTAAVNFASTYDKASIFFGFGTTGAQAGGAKTSFFDDVSFPEGEPPPPPVGDFATITFDDAGIMYGLVGFGGAEDAIVTADPMNAQNQVARVIKSANAELWAGTTFTTRPNNAVGRIALAPGRTRMTIRVYSPDAGVQVRLKVENANDPTVSVETEATTTVANQWEVLTFDFAAQAPGTAAVNFAATYDKASIFFGFGTTGAQAGGAKTSFFDDVSFPEGEPPPPPVGDFATITFDDAGIMYGLVGFGGAEDSIVTADPTDAQNQVARVIKSANAELWAGTTFSTRPNNAVGRIALAPGRTRMTIRVYSPDAGVQVRLKVENANDPTVSVETEATTTVANQWEVLTFDFATQAPGTAAVNFAATYDKASIFFGFGTTGAQAGGAKTSFFDDVSFLP